MSEIKVVDIFDASLREDLLVFIRNKRLIPVIGSGFTRNCKSTSGRVPSGQDMKAYMIEKLKEQFPSEIFSEDFSKVAQQYESFIREVERKRYLHANFTNVQIEWYKKKFLQIDWPYLYTLNIDDAIENSSDYTVILPLSEINQDYEMAVNNKPLYKLHGDVKHYLTYKGSKMFIFSQTQYLNSLQQNTDLLSKLSADIRSNCVMYLGCSLADEIDILYSLNISGYTPPNMKRTYYVTDRDLSELQQRELQMYGIDTIIRINTYEDFYQFLWEIYENSLKIPKTEIDSFLNPKTVVEEKGYNENIEYIYKSNKMFDKFDVDKRIVLPYFFIERDIFRNKYAYEQRFVKKNLVIIYGHRFSGKTYLLVDLMQRMHNQNYYFIPSHYKINDETLKTLLSKKNCTLFFDTGSVNDSQIESIYIHFDNLIKNNCRVVITLDSSEKENLAALNKYSVAKEMEDKISKNYLDNGFTDGELHVINKKLDACAIGRFGNKRKGKQKNRLTILDNIFELISEAPHSSLKSGYFKDINEIEIDNDRMIALIVLATQNRLSATDMSLFNLNESIGKFIEILKPISQFEYTSEIERSSNDHSGTKVIVNSRYWVLHELGKFSLVGRNIPKISKAYKSIVEALLKNSSKSYKGRRQAAKKISDFIKFDVINDIFPKATNGSSIVIKDIYAILEPLLNDDYQYFHQRAKSLAWSNNKEDLESALRFAVKSKRDMEVGHKDHTTQIAYMHVCYTIASIYTRLAKMHSYSNSEYTQKAADSIYEALKYDENLNYLTEENHLTRGSRNIVEFIKYLSVNSARLGISSEVANTLIKKVYQSKS